MQIETTIAAAIIGRGLLFADYGQMSMKLGGEEIKKDKALENCSCCFQCSRFEVICKIRLYLRVSAD